MFQARVRGCVSTSKEKIYDAPKMSDDPHAISFSTYQPAVHDCIREELKKKRVRNPYPERL